MAAAAILGLLCWWVVAGNKFWTDGGTLHVADAEARLREVVWTQPRPLAGLNTPEQEYEPSVSPDGDELYFVRGKAGHNPATAGHNADIYVSYRRMGAWTPPVPVDAVNSDYDDLGPRVTGDGRFLVFYSNRPGGFGGYDIWAAPRLAAEENRPGGWGKPFNLGPSVNSEFDEYNPDPSPDGKRLFFSTNRKSAAREQREAWRATIRAGSGADFDLWYAQRVEGGVATDPSAIFPATQPDASPATQPTTEPSPPAPTLAFANAAEVPGVNTPFAEGASCMSPAGDFLYFASDRPGGFGRFDIYRCRVSPDGKFGIVENLGPGINTSDNETDPQLALNGFRLYFSSDRPLAASDSAGPPAPEAAASGHYDLLQSDSREVYAAHAGHPLPHLGWSWLVLALSLLCLVPLVMFMRKWDDQRLNLIQRCLLVSLLVHLLITLGASLFKVTTDVYHYVRVEQGLEPPVDLSLVLNGPAGQGDEIGASVRQQSSSDLPTAMVPPAAAAPQALPGAEALEAPSEIRMDAPHAVADPSGVAVRITTPEPQPHKTIADAAPVVPVMPSAAPRTDLPDLTIQTPSRLSQQEAVARLDPASIVPAARVDPGASPKLDIPEMKIGGEAAAPAAAQAGSLAEPGAVVHPAATVADSTAHVPQPTVQSPPSATPVVGEPRRPLASPVASAGPDAPSVAEAAVTSARDSTAAANGAGIRPAAIEPEMPAVGRSDLSAASASIGTRSASMRAADTAALAQLPSADQRVNPEAATPLVTAPMSGAGPLAAVHADSPTPAELLAGASRVGHTAVLDGTALPTISPSSPITPTAAPTGSGVSLSPDVTKVAHRDTVAPAVDVKPAAPGGVSDTALGSLPQGASLAKPIISARPEVLTPAEVLVAEHRQGSPAPATTRPAGLDANPLAGLAEAAPPAAAKSGESLAGPIETANAGAHSPLVGTTAVQVAEIKPDASAGQIGATQHMAAAPKTADEASPSTGVEAASALASTAVGHSAGADTVAQASGDRSVAIGLTAASAAAEKSAADPAAPAVGSGRALDTASAVAMAGPADRADGHGLRDFATSPDIKARRNDLAPLAALAKELQGPAPSEVAAAPRKMDVGAGAQPLASAKQEVPATELPASKGAADNQSFAAVSAAAPRTVLPDVGKTPGGGIAEVAAGASVNIGASRPIAVKASARTTNSADIPASPAGSPGPADAGVSRVDAKSDLATGRPHDRVQLASASIPGVSEMPRTVINGKESASDDPSAGPTHPRAIAGPRVSAPDVIVALPKLAAPEALFQRSPEQRKPLVEKRGGTPESEGAVDRALAYLAREQESDGRWTVFNDDAIHPGGRGRHPHDMACTGLATLAFLTADQTPAKEGPYRDVVARSLDYLMARQGPDGDLRGAKDMRGGGADQGNLYDHGICTMALSEAALMTGDRRYSDAAEKAAAFIVASQNPQGGWRYSPGEPGDTSVVGWQVLALHDAEQLGFKVPELTRSRAAGFIKSVSHGNNKILGSYIPNEAPTSSMTAEALFVRMLLGVEISDIQSREVSAYLTREMPERGNADFYFWYYASLSLSQMSDAGRPGADARNNRPVADGAAKAMSAADAWKKWNAKTRDTLIAMQKKGGAGEGSWSDSRWVDRGGHAFTTSLATLTLEVYYRYLPLRVNADDSDPLDDAQRASATLRPTGSALASPTAMRRGAPASANHPKGWKDEGGHYPGVEPN